MLVLGLAVLLPLASHAQKDSAKDSAVVDLVNTARKLYEDLDYERALEVLARARQLKHGQEADVSLWLYQGMILFDIGKHEESARSFRQALEQRPQVKLPIAMVSPKLGQFFESLRKEFAQPQVDARAPTPRTATAPPLEPPRPLQGWREPGLQERQDSGRGRFTPQVLISAAAGSSLLATGGLFFGLSKGERARLRADDARLGTLEDVRRSTSRGQTYQTLGLGLMGAGLVGLGVATGLHVLRDPEAPMSLTVSTDGTSAYVQGRWP